MTSNPPDELLRDHQACQLIGCSKSTFWRRVADGTFPRPLKIGGLSRWPQSEILNAIELAKTRRNAANLNKQANLARGGK